MNVVLVGSRGSGKSAVAKSLARVLARETVSTDTEVQRRAGCSIAEFVSREGWDSFRDLEEEVVRDIAAQKDLIIDTGGGVVLRQANVDALRANGCVFWLQAPIPVLAARIKDDTSRPSLTGTKSAVDELAEVLAARAPLYSAAAHYRIETDGQTPDEIADRIAQIVRG